MLKNFPSLVASILSLAGLLAQSDPLIRVQSERVLMDVIVVDAQGNFVRDLKTSDFLVRENGKHRPVTNLVLVDKQLPARTSPASAKRSDPETFLPYLKALQEDRIIVVLDRISVDNNSYHRAIESLRYLASHLPRDSQIGLLLFDGNLELIHPLSDNRESLLQALAEIDERQPRLRISREGEALEEIASLFTERLALGFQITDTTSIQQILQRTVSDAVSIANRHLRESEQQVNTFLRGMRSLVRTLGNIPGEKTLLLLSGGYSLYQGDDLRDTIRDNLQGRLQGAGQSSFENALVAQAGQVDSLSFHSEFSELIGLANRHRVRFYTVDPGGLEALPPGGLASEGTSFYQLLNLPERKFFRDLNRLSEPTDSLRALAVETNGLAFYNRNSLEDVLDRVLEHNSVYYLLGYEPNPDRQENRFHRVKVELRAGLKFQVVAEQGYYLTEEPGFETQKQYALAFPGLFQEIPVSSSHALFRRQHDYITMVSLEIPGQALPFVRVGGNFVANLDLYLFFLDERGQEKHRKLDHFKLELDPEQHREFQNRSFIYHGDFELPGGQYEMRAIVANQDTAKIGATRSRLQVPDHASNEVAMSDLVLSQDIRQTAQHGWGPLFMGSYRVVPEGDNRARLEDPLYVYFQIYNLAFRETAPRATVQVRLSDASSHLLYQSQLISIDSVDEEQSASVSHQIPVPELKLFPGDYRVEIELRDLEGGGMLTRNLQVQLFAARNELGNPDFR